MESSQNNSNNSNNNIPLNPLKLLQPNVPWKDSSENLKILIKHKLHPEITLAGHLTKESSSKIRLASDSTWKDPLLGKFKVYKISRKPSNSGFYMVLPDDIIWMIHRSNTHLQDALLQHNVCKCIYIYDIVIEIYIIFWDRVHQQFPTNLPTSGLILGCGP